MADNSAVQRYVIAHAEMEEAEARLEDAESRADRELPEVKRLMALGKFVPQEVVLLDGKRYRVEAVPRQGMDIQVKEILGNSGVVWPGG